MTLTFRSEAIDQISNGQYVEGLNSVDWDEEKRQTLENVLHNSTQGVYCTGGGFEVSLICRTCIEQECMEKPKSECGKCLYFLCPYTIKMCTTGKAWNQG